MLRLAIVSTILLLISGVYWWLKAKVINHFPRNYPHKNIKGALPAVSQKTVVCAGDSITHGNMGVSYVEMLEKWLGRTCFFYNAGRNADLTYTLSTRLDEIIARQPEYITLLIGTNDVNATLGEVALRTYWQIGRLDKGTRPSFETFQANYTHVVERLLHETSAKIALLSLPVMGEDLLSTANERADQYSRFIKELARQKGLAYLPVRERMRAFLQQNPKSVRFSFEKTAYLVNLCMVRHYLFGYSWNAIAMLHGNDLTHDNLHLNTRGAAIIATEVERFLLSPLRDDTVPRMDTAGQSSQA